MKTLKSFMLLVGILLGSTVFYSCLDDDDAYSEFWRDSVQAIVTVKPLSDNSYLYAARRQYDAVPDKLICA